MIDDRVDCGMLCISQGATVSLTPDELRSIPLLAAFSDQQLEDFLSVFERLELPPGSQLCKAGDLADQFYILERGTLTLSDGDRVHFEVSPPAPIGELGALGLSATDG